MIAGAAAPFFSGCPRSSIPWGRGFFVLHPPRGQSRPMATGDVIRLGGGQAAFPVRQRRALEPLLAAAPPYPMGWPHSWKFMREQFIKEKKCPCVNIAVGAAFPFQPTHPPESVRRFPSNHGRCYLADRAYAKGSHRAYTLKRGAGFTFRLPPSLVKQFTPPQRDQRMDRPCLPRNPSASTAISDTGARSMGYGWRERCCPRRRGTRLYSAHGKNLERGRTSPGPVRRNMSVGLR